MSNKDRKKMWEERVAQWRASGLSQRAYATEQGFPIRQVGYWVRRLAKSPPMPGLSACTCSKLSGFMKCQYSPSL